MLQHNGRRFRLYPWKAKFTDKHGQEQEKWALPNKEWWQSVAERHGFEVEFEEVTLMEEQQARYEEIRQIDIPEQFRSHCIDYIMDGDFPDGFVHYLREIELKQEQEDQDDLLTDILLGKV